MRPVEIVLIAGLFAGIIGSMWYMFWHVVKDINRHEDLIIRLAKKLADTKEDIANVDQSTGVEIHRLEQTLKSFREEYGDAAIDAQREAARAEKAWADGVNAIMSYGPGHYDRGGNG